jgi:hypothetical protein
LVAVEMEEVRQVFREIPDCVDGELDSEVCGVAIAVCWICRMVSLQRVEFS